MRLDTRWIAVVALVGTVAPLPAQEAEVTVGAALMSDASGVGKAGLRIAPSLAGSAPRGGWHMAASLFLPQGSGAWVTAGAGAHVTLGTSGPLSATVDGSATAEGIGDGARAATIHLAPAARFVGERWGASLGPVLGASYTRGAAGPDPWPRLPIGPAGGAETGHRSLLAYRAAVWAGNTRSAGTATWSATTLGEARWREASARLRHQAGAVELGASGGVRHGDLAESWISGSVSLRLLDPLAITAELGRHPSDPLGARAAGRFAVLSLSYRPRRGPAGAAATAPAVARPAPRVVRVSIAAPEGADVRIAGEWNGWTPQPLARGADGGYAAELRLLPGTYRFVVHVDGEPRVPDGYPSEADAFGGRSALLRVPPGS